MEGLMLNQLVCFLNLYGGSEKVFQGLYGLNVQFGICYNDEAFGNCLV